MIKIKPSNRSIKVESKVGDFFFKMLATESSSKNKLTNLSTLDSTYFGKLPNVKLTNKIYNKLLDQNNHHYGSSIGDLETRKVISSFLSNSKIQFNEEDLIISYGGIGSLNNLLFSVLDKNDSIIIGKPYYSQSSAITSFLDINILFYNFNLKNELINFESLRNDILKRNNKPKAFFVIDPNNPMNIQLDRAQIENIFKLCKEFNMFLILDNIFQKSVYNTDNFNDYVDMHMQYKVPIFVISSITKSFNFPGSRFGYLLKIDKENRFKQIWEDGLKNFVQIPLSINTYIQKGVKEYFMENPDGDMEIIKKDLEFYKENRDFVLEKLKDNKILKPFKNSSSYFMYIELDLTQLKFDTAEEFVLKLYDNTNILVYPSEVFYGEVPFIRMTIGISRNTLNISLDRIIEFINSNLSI